MLDTLMVMWTSGLWKHLLRTLATFTLLFGCVCVLSYLITSSGGQWSGLAASFAQSHMSVPFQSSAPTEAVRPAAAPTARPTSIPYVIPAIVQNPVSEASSVHSGESAQKHIHHHTYTAQPPAYTQPQPAVPERTPDTGSSDFTNPLQNMP